MATLTPISNETQLLIQSICASVMKGSWNNLLRPKFGSNDYHLITTTETVRQVLLRLSLYDRSPCLSWAFFRWIETSVPNYKHPLQSSWTMLYILTKHKHFQTAHAFLENIAFKDFLSTQSVLSSLVKIHDDPDVNSHVLSWLMIVYGNSKMTHEAIQVFEHMRVNGFRPHLHACTVLLNSLAKERLTDTVWKVYKKMVKLGVVANIHVYNVLLHACSKSGDVEKAEKVLSEMESKCVFSDLFTYNTLISLYYCYCKQQNEEAVIKLPDELVRRGLCADVSVYRALIRRFCKIEKIDCAQRVLGLMKDKGIFGDSVIYTSLAYAYWKIGKVNVTSDILDEMYKKRLMITLKIYRSFSASYSSDSSILSLFWNQVLERHLMSKNILKDMQ
ncbi:PENTATRICOPEPTIDE REPEAT-CONTAINING PROTEIN [Salix viminalis]|uniref:PENTATRICOPEPTIDE REPEAT-CONTAINING PROTEIN n=1 Tax=Salix viminalis TaxID=40686 RepID=A0A9Q0PA58_SALVM|nr:PENTATRICOPEPTIDE REPEAT-CONTAINING PROTEIN [Salix viminalis]